MRRPDTLDVLMSFTKWFRRPHPPRPLRLTIQFFVEPDDGGFHAFSPALKGLHVDGATAHEAAQQFVAAVPAYLQSVLQHGEPLPIGVVVEVPGGAEPHLEEVTVPWVPPSLLTSGDSSRA
jgi:predicted RNase H-like HicB family nuclease